MKGKKRKAVHCLAIIASVATALPANAMIPVFDIPNFFVNLGIKSQLIGIRNQLENKTERGTVNYNTMWIDKSTKSIDKSTIKIDKSTQQIDITTTSILDYNVKNYEINNEFTWIINNGDGEIIPIPEPVQKKLEAILDDQNVKEFTAHYKKAADFGEGVLPTGGREVAIEGSRARKAANDALVESVNSEQQAFGGEFSDLKKLAEQTQKAQGQGHQLQVANALAGTQVYQMMKLRSMMVASEAVRATESQVAADKDARAIAVGHHMRKGLDRAVSQSIAPRAAY